MVPWNSSVEYAALRCGYNHIPTNPHLSLSYTTCVVGSVDVCDIVDVQLAQTQPGIRGTIHCCFGTQSIESQSAVSGRVVVPEKCGTPINYDSYVD